MGQPTTAEIAEFLRRRPVAGDASAAQAWPRISIVTPSFNQGAFLERTIRSVLNQGYANLEYLVMDGGSADDSPDIIRRHGQSLAGWVSEPDGGQGAAIAKGFARATGDVLGWLNSDDILLPGALDAVAAAFRVDRGAGFVHGHCVLIDEADRVVDRLFTYPMSARQYVLGHGNLFQGAAFWTRDAYDRAGGMDTTLRYAMEYKLFDRFFAAERVRFVNRALAGFRLHGAQKGATMPEVGREELATLRAGLRARPAENLVYRLNRYWQLFATGNAAAKLGATWRRGRLPRAARALARR